MRPIQLLNMALICLLLLSPGAAEAADRAGIRHLFDKSGLTRQTESMPEMIQETFKELIVQTPTREETVNAWRAAADRAYAPDRIMSRLTDIFSEAFTDEEQAELMRFLESPLGRRIVQYEGSTADADPEQYAAPLRKLQENPKANGKRLSLYYEVDKATGGAESWVVQRMTGVLVMEIAMLSAADRTDAIRVKEFRAKLEHEHAKMLEDATQSYAMASAFAYKDLSDEELAEYIRVSKTPVWRKYTRETLKALDKVLIECAQTLTRELAIRTGGAKAL
jgi:hypothetical protein